MGAATSDGRSDSPHFVCQSHCRHARRPHVMAPAPALTTILIHYHIPGRQPHSASGQHRAYVSGTVRAPGEWGSKQGRCLMRRRGGGGWRLRASAAGPGAPVLASTSPTASPLSSSLSQRLAAVNKSPAPDQPSPLQAPFIRLMLALGIGVPTILQ